MERFFGFDLGDAESAVAVLGKEKTSKPEVLTVCDAKSFITAYARTMDREGILIGENACYAQNTSERHLRFKSRYGYQKLCGRRAGRAVCLRRSDPE